MTYPSEELAAHVLGALAGAGVRDVVYCPGSRSAPFAYALERACHAGWMRTHVRLDERSAAFLALGLARGTEGEDRPVAVVTTSGTAVAELHAGVAEADHGQVPLLVVSADRPFEMRGVGASQTTTQPGIFGPHIRGMWDVPADTQPDRSLRALIGRAVARAQGLPSGVAGPVHINVGLRDPLIPQRFDDESSPSPLVVPRVLSCPPNPCAWNEAVDPTLRTLIVAGDGADRAAPTWAKAAGIPLVAEPTSGVRRAAECLPHEQTLIAAPELGGRVEQVVLTGRPTLSRGVSALLARRDVRVVVQCAHGQWPDVAGNAALITPALAPAHRPHADTQWQEEWVHAAAHTTRVIDALLAEYSQTPNVLNVARAVWDCAPALLFVGASNSVRALDLVASTRGPERVLANRGLAGIDGTLATSIGVALAAGVQTCALVGDLTFLHDAGALAIPTDEDRPDLRIIVVDDNGGAIFAGLEHGRAPREIFDRWFRTAQPTRIRELCDAYGLTYRQAQTMEEITTVLSHPVDGIEVLHICLSSMPHLFAHIRDLLTHREGPCPSSSTARAYAVGIE